MNKVDTIKKKLLGQLQQCKGTITTACINSGISRTTFYEYYNLDSDFRDKVMEVQEASIDHVENMLMKKIDEGDTTAIIFYLKTKGRKRGYNEKLIIEETVKQTQANEIDYSLLSTETLLEIIEVGCKSKEVVSTPIQFKPDWLL